MAHYWVSADIGNYWTEESGQAWGYGSVVAFYDAEHHGGKVYLRLVSGREIEVTREDLGYPDV